MGQGRRGGLFPLSVRGMLFVLLVVVLAPILLVDAGIYYRRYEEQRAQEYQASLEIARAVAVAFEAYLQDVRRQEFSLGLALTALQPFSGEQASRFLTATAAQYPSIRDFSWTDPHGHIIASSLAASIGQDVGDRAYFQAIAQGRQWVVSDLLQEQGTAEPTFVIASAMRENDALRGVLVATVDPRQLGGALPVERAGSGAISIIDGQGWGVYRYPEVPLAWEDRNWIESQPIIGPALAGNEVADTFVSTIDGNLLMTGLAPIRSIGWVAGASRPEVEVMASVRDDLLRDALLIVAASLFALCAALLIGRRLSVPLDQLSRYALAAGRGELDHPIAVDGPAEVAALARAFNSMAAEIKVQHGKLRTQNEELQARAAELAAQMAERERLVRAVAEKEATLQAEQRAAAERERLLGQVGELAEVAERRAAELQAILDNMLDAVFVCDLSGRITLSNEAGWQLLGLAKREEIGLSLAKLATRLRLRHIDGPPIAAQELPLARALAGEAVVHEYALARGGPQGCDVYLRTSAAPIKDERGSIVGAVAVARDVTEIAELDRMRAQFLEVASHELRTPLTVIRAYAQWLLRQSRDERANRPLEIITKHADRIDELLQEMLSVSALRTGRVGLHLARFDLAALVEEVVARMQRVAEKHRLRFHSVGAIFVEADRNQIDVVLTNLLDNAVRYSPRGGDVEITVGACGGELIVSVQDDGLGISTDEQSRVFEPFFQMQPAIAGFGGMGLGLYISKQIVQRHGGRIWFESVEGQGSVFHFSLPISA